MIIIYYFMIIIIIFCLTVCFHFYILLHWSMVFFDLHGP